MTTVILSRPEARNAVDRPTADALTAAFLAFEQDAEARVAVLWGEGGTFCAGADLKSIGGERQNRIEPPRPDHPGPDQPGPDHPSQGPLGPSRLELDKPVIAAVSGHAVAGGLELALWCDLRVVEADAVLGVFCRRWGVPLIDGGTVRLPRLIGLSQAMDLILTGRPVGAAEAERMGLANRVVAAGQARAAAEALAAQIAAFPQACLRSDRRAALRQHGLGLQDALALEFAEGVPSLRAEGVSGAARFASGAGRHGSFED